MIPNSWYTAVSGVLGSYPTNPTVNSEDEFTPPSSSTHTTPIHALPGVIGGGISVKHAEQNVITTHPQMSTSNRCLVDASTQTDPLSPDAGKEVVDKKKSWFESLPRNFDLSRLSNMVTFNQAPAAPDTLATSDTVTTRSSFSVHGHYVEIEGMLSMQKAHVEEMLLHSAIAKAAYRGYEDLLLKTERILKNNPAIEQTSWQLFDLPEAIRSQLDLERLDDSRFYHNASHLVVLFLWNQEQKSIVISFGGTSSGKNTDRLFYRLINNTTTTFNQWKRNFHSAGAHFLKEDVPDCYLKAAEIAGQIKKLVAEDPRYEGYKLSMTGHSKGGAEAAYATLTHPTIPSICFATPPLGKRVLGSISPENLLLAKDNIQHYFVKYDVIPAINTTLKPILETAHVGRGTWLPAPAHIVSGLFYPLWAHVHIHDIITHHAETHFKASNDVANLPGVTAEESLVVELAREDSDSNAEGVTNSNANDQHNLDSSAVSHQEIGGLSDEVEHDDFNARLFEMQMRFMT